MLNKNNLRILYPLLIILVTTTVFYPVYKFDFLNFDDPIYVTENPNILGGVTKESIHWAFTSEHGAHWHPFAWISHMIDIELFGLNAGAHHLVNVGIHTTNAILLFFLINLLTGSLNLGLFIALAFAIHPLRIESVVWISERKDVLSMFFALASFITYIKFTTTKSLKSYTFSLLLLIFSLLSKPSAVILPVLFLLLDYYPLARFKRYNLKNLFLEKIPFFVAVLFCALAALWAQGEGGGLKSLAEYPISLRLASAWVGYLTYLAKFFFPYQIGIFYPFEVYQPGVGLGAFLGVLALSYICWTSRVRYPAILFGWLWFIISLFLVIGFVQIGGQAYADRWSYLPHIGLLIGCCDIWRQTIWPNNKSLSRISAVIIVLALATWTKVQIPKWRNSESVFKHTLAVSPRNFMAHTNLGHYYYNVGNFDKAAHHYEQAVNIAPTYPIPLTNLASIRIHQGKYAEAESLLLKSLIKNPTSEATLHNLGAIYYQRKEFLPALHYWLRSYAFNPAATKSKEGIYTILRIFWERKCELFANNRDEHIYKEIETLYKKWLFPPDTPMRMGLSAVIECRNVQ